MQSPLARFVKSAEGAITQFTLILFVLFLAFAGMGADYMRYELYRAELQNALDRAVLAATAFSQEEDPVTVIEDFVNDSPKWSGAYGLPTVTVTRSPNDETWFETTINDRELTATAKVEFSTIFMNLIGRQSFEIATSATAKQSRKPVEVVMVLDISMSMDSNDTAANEAKIYGLRREAKKFIDQVLTPETKDLTSITLIPFAGTVNPGPFLDHMLIDTGWVAEWSESALLDWPSCPQFIPADFNGTERDRVSTTRLFPLHTVFKKYGFPGQTNEIGWSWCPDSSAGIVVHSNNAEALKTRIDSMQMYDGTGIDIALKWGLYALSPTSRPVIDQMIIDGTVDGNFTGWPHDYDDANVEKYVVFLTDGGITAQFDVIDEMWDGTLADLEDRDDIFENETEQDEVIAHIGEFIDSDDRLADYWSRPNDNFHNLVPDKTEERDNRTKGIFNGSNVRFTNENKRHIQGVEHRMWTNQQAIQHVENICSFFKQKRPDGLDYARVFTIGFNLDINQDAPATASQITSKEERVAFSLDYCATYDQDRFLATSANLDTAFEEIASQINSLRLSE